MDVTYDPGNPASGLGGINVKRRECTAGDGSETSDGYQKVQAVLYMVLPSKVRTWDWREGLATPPDTQQMSEANFVTLLDDMNKNVFWLDEDGPNCNGPYPDNATPDFLGLPSYLRDSHVDVGFQSDGGADADHYVAGFPRDCHDDYGNAFDLLGPHQILFVWDLPPGTVACCMGGTTKIVAKFSCDKVSLAHELGHSVNLHDVWPYDYTPEIQNLMWWNASGGNGYIRNIVTARATLFGAPTGPPLTEAQKQTFETAP